MSVTLRFQSTGSVPGDGAPIEMRGAGLTIGRGAENDVVLPDPDRLISKNHCTIEDREGEVTVIDFSTNGTFLNYGKTPLGRVPTPLNDGDVLSMGAYEMIVAIVSQRRTDPMAGLPPPAGEAPVSHGRASARSESLEDLLSDPGAKKADFLDDLMGAAPPTGPSQIVREDPVDQLMLPHVGGGDDPILGPLPDPDERDFSGMQADTGPSVSDSFSAPRRASSVIPDDWDDDVLGHAPKAPAPGPAPSVARAVPVANLPPLDVGDLLPRDRLADPAPAVTPTPQTPATQDPGSAASPALAHPVRPMTAPADSGAPAPADDAAPPSPFAAPVAKPERLTSSVVPAPPPVQRSVPLKPPVVLSAASHAADPGTTARSTSGGPPHAAASDAARAFFTGAGAEDLAISDAELAATMERLGRVMSTLIGGLREILMTRTSIKSEFRINQTQISAGGNNPLKFALSPENAVEMILRPNAKGYMDGITAVQEALRDIKAHEVAMVTGMEAAIKDVLARLDPKTLEEKFGAGGGFLKGRKSHYWEMYEKLFAELSEEAAHDFHEFFSKEFARAYQNQLERLK